MRTRRRLALLVLIGCVALQVFAQGCASARLRRETAVGLQKADALAARGCHACLVDALAIFERLKPADTVHQQLVARRVVRTSLLLALRAKELGLDPQPHLDRARARLGASPTAADAQRLELADALPSNPSGLTREQLDREAQRFQAARPAIEARLARDRRTSDDPELDAYLDLAFVCTGRVVTKPNLKPESLLPTPNPGPLLAWRLGACSATHESSLDRALAAEPRFVETSLYVGRYRLAAAAGRGGRPTSWREVRDAFTKALEAFPDSPAIAQELANATRTRSFRDALPLYERVIAKVPGHQDAWMGKGICESYLGRHLDAIATFTHLMELGRYNVGTAYYWRAWNRHQLKELDAAWADVELAKQTLYNSDLYTLAGIIAYGRKELDVARTHLEKGLELQARNCPAAWYLGLVHAGQEHWSQSADTFISSASCYRLDADDGRRELALAEALDDTVETKASQIASARGTIDESMRQEALSAYNAAYGFVRAQAADRARPLLETARQHADVKARADELLAYVDRPQSDRR